MVALMAGGCIALGSAGCGDPSSQSSYDGTAYVRIINAVFQGDTANATPIAIDYLIDSSDASPGVADLAPGSWAPPQGEYLPIRTGIHSFVARRHGDAEQLGSLFTTMGSVPYLPHQALTNGTHYTLVASGVVPDSGLIDSSRVPFTILVDDPFPGPTVQGVFQARFHVINAAPFTRTNGEGRSVAIYLTADTLPPAGPITQYAPLATQGYLSPPAYIDVTPGTYVITLAGASTIFAQQRITFGPGQVLTLVLQSTGPSTTPGLANHQLIPIVDQTYAP
jgi:hypothetical protein